MWKHPPHDFLRTVGPPGPRTLWSVPVHKSLQYLSLNLLHPATGDLGSGVPTSITPAVSQRSTGAGEVRNPSGLTVQTPADRPGDPSIVFRTPGIAQVITKHPSLHSRLLSSDFSSDFSSVQTSLLFGLQ